MDNLALFSELKLVFEKLGVEVSELKLDSETGRAQSGMARVYQKNCLYLDKTLALEEKINVMIQALKGFDLAGVYLSPYLRARVEMQNEKES
jgi:hypothetical protein